jgi:DNA-binding XRE family transcriptional regulator
VPQLCASFWDHVEKTDGCWLWTKSCNAEGYGQLWASSGASRKKRNIGAHVYAYELTHGPVPEGLEIDHSCFVPRCVRPDHLEAVTREENHRRRHGRPKGPIGRKKLTDMDGMGNPFIDELEKMRVEAGLSKWELARRLGVSRHTVTRKLSGETELSVGEAYALCQILGTTLNEVLLDLEATTPDLASALRSRP